MAMRDGEKVYLRGTIYWAKIFDEPRPGYARPGTTATFREWSFEFEPDDLAAVEAAGLSHKLRDKSDKKGYEGRRPFLYFKRKEFNRKGERSDNIRVVNAADKPWPKDTLIGNGSRVDVKIAVFPDEGGDKNFDSMYANAIRVMELVRYASADFEPVAEDDEYFEKAKAARDTFNEDFGMAEPSENPDVGKARKKATPAKGELDDEIIV